MMKMLFSYPDNDLHLNLAIIMVIVRFLSETKRGTQKLNNDRLHVYHFLVKNPVKLNHVMVNLGKENVLLSQQNSYSVASISANVDPLFDRESLKSLLTLLISKKLLEVKYTKADGFIYILTERGKELTNSFKEGYFTEIALSCNRLKSTLSVSQSNLNNALGQIMRRDAF